MAEFLSNLTALVFCKIASKLFSAITELQPLLKIDVECYLFSDQVFYVLVVFLADVFNELAFEHRRVRREFPGGGVRRRIIDRLLELEVTQIDAAQLYNHVQLFGGGQTRFVDPG